jgi:hypothetical protein
MTWQETGYLLMLFNGSLSAGDLVAESYVLFAATVIIQQYAFNCLKNTVWLKDVPVLLRHYTRIVAPHTGSLI